MRQETITINLAATAKWDIRHALGFSEMMHIEHHPRSQRIACVDLRQVTMVPCEDEAGNLMRGVDVLRRFGKFTDHREHPLVKASRDFAAWYRTLTTWSTGKLTPLGATLYPYCHDQIEVFDVLVERSGLKNPHFFLDGVVLWDIVAQMMYTIEVYRGLGGKYRCMLASVDKRRGDNDFSLAYG